MFIPWSNPDAWIRIVSCKQLKPILKDLRKMEGPEWIWWDLETEASAIGPGEAMQPGPQQISCWKIKTSDIKGGHRSIHLVCPRGIWDIPTGPTVSPGLSASTVSGIPALPKDLGGILVAADGPKGGFSTPLALTAGSREDAADWVSLCLYACAGALLAKETGKAGVQPLWLSLWKLMVSASDRQT